MSKGDRSRSGLQHFRRSLTYLRPHGRTLIIGLLFAVGVSVFYTFSISSVIPLLKVIFAEHETLVDWIHRVDVERRLDVVIASDLPDDRDGLLILQVRPNSRSRAFLDDGMRIVSIKGEAPGSHGLMRLIAEHPDKDLEQVVLRRPNGDETTVDLAMRSYHWWSTTLRSVAAVMPKGKDPDSRLMTLGIVMGALVLISILGGVCRLLNEGLVAVAVQRAIHDLRSRMADHVLRLPLEWHTSQPPGDTLGRFATDLGKLEVGVSTLFGKVIREPLKAAGVIALTAAIDWKLLVVAVLGVPIGAIVMAVFGRSVKKAQKRASESWGRLLDHLGEKLAGIRVVKAYGMQGQESKRFEKEGRELTGAQTHIEWVDAATNPALETLAVFGVAAFVLYGGSRVFALELEPHLFFAATVCLGGIFDPVRKMGNVNNRLQAADASAKRLFDLMDLKTEEPPSSGGVELPRLHGAIEFRGVSFAYPLHPERSVIDELNLTVRKGQVVALVGPNGSGKTTLMSLLLRFYEPCRGKILIDGTDIATVTLDSLREQIGLVTQDSVVFSATIRDNIAYGVNGMATDEAVARAARRAHIDDFIQTLRSGGPDGDASGYSTPVTARSLSGGQRQRIALARAILRDPPILILDEATSQVDSESERKIQEALEDVMRDRTTFIIAHRYSTIARADMIVVLDQGRLIACGRHDDLIKTCPFYVTLCKTQFTDAG
ncbi:MAG: ABC transporter ATP-binding protein [Phycisphaerales bacterium]|nr:ABC transporter ATP-binding protein [Phycisphaerales bacterium]